MSTDAKPATGGMEADPALIRAVDTLESIEDCLLPGGESECPICGDSFGSQGFTAHMRRGHGTCVPEVSLGTESWREVLSVCYSEHGMSPHRIADHIPGHTSYRIVKAEIERFGLERAAMDYGHGRVRHPDDPFEAVVRETWHAAQVYLEDPRSSTFSCKSLAETVDLDQDLVTKALRELKSRGRVRAVNSTTPYRWVLAEDGGDEA